MGIWIYEEKQHSSSAYFTSFYLIITQTDINNNGLTCIPMLNEPCMRELKGDNAGKTIFVV